MFPKFCMRVLMGTFLKLSLAGVKKKKKANNIGDELFGASVEKGKGNLGNIHMAIRRSSLGV